MALSLPRTDNSHPALATLLTLTLPAPGGGAIPAVLMQLILPEPRPALRIVELRLLFALTSAEALHRPVGPRCRRARGGVQAAPPALRGRGSKSRDPPVSSLPRAAGEGRGGGGGSSDPDVRRAVAARIPLPSTNGTRIPLPSPYAAGTAGFAISTAFCAAAAAPASPPPETVTMGEANSMPCSANSFLIIA